MAYGYKVYSERGSWKLANMTPCVQDGTYIEAIRCVGWKITWGSFHGDNLNIGELPQK